MSQSHTTYNIGFYQPVIHQGGTARVTSLLLQLLKREGHTIILYTEDYVYEDCFYIPADIVRVKLPDINKNRVKRQNILMHNMRLFQNEVFIINKNYYYSDILGAYTLKIPILVIFHEQIMNIDRFVRKYRKRFLLIDCIVVQSNHDRFICESLGLNSCYIPNPVDDALMKEYPEMNYSKEMIWVGRLYPDEKKPIEALEIAKKVAQRIPYVKMEMLGSSGSEYYDKLFEYEIRQRKLEKNVVWRGFIKDPYLHYRSALFQIITSTTESYSMALLESKFMGIPCVMYDIPYNELASCGKGIILVEQGDINTFSDQCIELILNRKKYMELKDQVKESVLELMSVDVYSLWYNLFSQII